MPGHGQPGGELACPEVLCRHAHIACACLRRKVEKHRVGVYDNTAADRAVKRVDGAAPGRVRRIDIAAPDLGARVDIRAVHGGSLCVHDAVHIRKAFERRKVREGRALPDAVALLLQVHCRACWIDSRAVVVNIPALRLAEYHIHALGIRCPHGEAEAGYGVAGSVVLVCAESPAESEVVSLHLWVGTARLQDEPAIPIHRVYVLHFGGHSPEVGTLRAVQDHAPLESLAHVREIELHGAFEGRAPVRADVLQHWRVGPLVGVASGRVPASAQAGIAEYRARKPGHEPELCGLGRHGDAPMFPCLRERGARRCLERLERRRAASQMLRCGQDPE
jgi:hypothetical protein